MENEQKYFFLIKNGDVQNLKEALITNPHDIAILPYGQPLAMHAVFENQLEILKFLISHGADLNKGDNDNFTPLQAAVQENNFQALEVILDANVNIEHEDSFGNTPLFNAVFECRDDTSIVSLLLRYGANPKHKNKSGVSPYDFAEKTKKNNVLALFETKSDGAFNLS